MKKLTFIFMFVVSSLFADTNEEIMNSILKNVLIKDTATAITSAKELLEVVKSKDSSKIDKAFKKFIIDWKGVQATYAAGDLNEDFLDTPRLMDIYHNANENIHEQLARALKSKDDLSIELFKNSFKSVNALEYILYNDNSLTNREIEATKIVVDTIVSHLEDIKNVYEKQSTYLIVDKNWANATIINALIASTYRLKEWRVAESAGLVKKYENNPDAKRAEYWLSSSSIEAIKGILLAHKRVMGEEKFKNFSNIATTNEAVEDVVRLRKVLDKTLKFLENFKESDLTTPKAKELYKLTKELHNSYYVSLINTLNIVPKILDADGD